VERRLQLTRRCLEVIVEFRNPVGLVTKNHLITHDIDLLQELARHQAAAAPLSVTTLASDLARRSEPRTLNDPRFGTRLRGEGLFAEQSSMRFHVACRKAGLATAGPELSTASFRRPAGAQLNLS
jgi:hypothetical protein